jgi:nicotinamidase-related amidase
VSSSAGLLVIDMQVGNFKESAPVYGGSDLLSRIRSLIARARAARVPGDLCSTLWVRELN